MDAPPLPTSPLFIMEVVIRVSCSASQNLYLPGTLPGGGGGGGGEEACRPLPCLQQPGRVLEAEFLG